VTGERGAAARGLAARGRVGPGARAGGSAAPDDLAAVLARALASLAEASGAERVAAWGRDAAGALAVLAARVEGAELPPPGEAAWSALAALSGPSELAAAADPVLRVLAEQDGFVAAAPVRNGADEPLAVLLVGGRESGGAVRPRLLAALANAAARCRRPAVAADAARRLARLDREVQRLDRLAAVGGLLAEIVHEIRNPLVSIKTFLHLLGEEGPGRAESGDFREVAIEELRRIERLLEAVMQHARPPSAPSAEAIAELEPAVRSVVQLVTLRAADRGITLEVALGAGLPPACIAGDALRQVLLNLALNAIEATPDAGRVRIATQEGEGAVAITLEDEGAGVSGELRARLFEPFFSTKARAGGLGLAITKRLVEDAGGTIAVEERAPSGSRFRVTLPAARA
jgi:signal transduction histidine kinase